MRLELECLNHACVLMKSGGIALLFDPWLEGTAFSGGWGLRYDNPHAFERARTATHLWISHWHSDHLHAPSLQKLAALNPHMVVLANESFNFSMLKRMRDLGFRNVMLVPERRPIELDGCVRVTRYPTAGIDNMLHVAGRDWSLLNYNDCNLPGRALSALAERIGPVDVLLTNYNHASKLFHGRDDGAVKDEYFAGLVRTVRAVAPRFVIPFASSHYYRTEDSAAQNASLIDFDELERRCAPDPRFVVLRTGDSATLEDDTFARHALHPPISRAPMVRHDPGPSIPWDQLVDAIGARCVALADRFPLGRWLVPALRVSVRDHQRSLLLRIGERPRELSGDESCQIRAHSRALFDWHGRNFGDDTFFAGAHFELRGSERRAIRAWALITLLDASHLDARSLLRYLGTSPGRAFLAHRREEIWATVIGFRVKASELRV